MSVSRLERPDWFNKKLYDILKQRGISDQHIRENMLFVSRVVYNRFKKEIGAVCKQGGSKKKYDYKKIKEMKLNGHSDAEIMERYGCARSTIGNVMRNGIQ